MKRLIGIAAAVVLAAPLAAFAADDMSVEAQIAQAVSPLPESLRADATVITYDAQGNPKVLRQGTNSIVCQPNQSKDSFAVSCYQKSMQPRREMEAKLRAEGKDAKAVTAAIQEATKSGQLKAPAFGTMLYSRSGKTEAEARTLWVMLVPNATAEATGLPTKRGEPGSPWMMAAGTPGAHIMMPQMSGAAPTPSK
jgi:hypothetical protein